MNDNNEDTYKIFHGLKPVKREKRQKGQSEYYYLDPRGTDRFADFKEIDVESEDSPNPKIKAILRDDLKKNERDYYIWLTRKDEKVSARIKTTVAPVVFTASGEVLLMSEGGVNQL